MPVMRWFLDLIYSEHTRTGADSGSNSLKWLPKSWDFVSGSVGIYSTTYRDQ